jgi:hydrogenase maturation protease
MQAGGKPGTVYTCGTQEVADAGVKASLHELNLLAALRSLPPGAKPEIVILGVEPENIDYGLDLSPRVAAALPVVTGAVREIVARWRESGN